MSSSKIVVADDPNDEDIDDEMEMTMFHPEKCLWLDCNNSPREGSKYCSDACGIQLAMVRIKMLLPDKVKTLQETPCVADLKNKQELEQLNRQIINIKMLLETLEGKRNALDKFIDEVYQIDYQAELEPMDTTGCDDSSSMMSCILCGHEVGLRSYVVHVERCFAKIEKYVVSVSFFPTHLPGKKILCENFDPRTRAYCRRLDVLCPEHNSNKEWNIEPRETVICGSPLTDEMDIKKVCRAARSKCRKHYNWETLRRADIDLQKWNAYVKCDLLVRKEQQIKRAMEERHSVLGLLLHTTTPEENNANEVDSDIILDEH